jgi:ABC-type uncharacterized transport system substrate-binding protein
MQFDQLKRREFISLLGGAAAAWPLAARAQPSDRMRHIGVLMNTATDDPEGKARNAAFERALQELGWTDGRNIRIDYRWGAGDVDRIRRYAAELVSLSPDVILTVGSATAGPLLQATRTVPIVFVQAPDPVGAGFVDSLARPGGNATGRQGARPRRAADSARPRRRGDRMIRREFITPLGGAAAAWPLVMKDIHAAPAY